jgi:stalled ribosome rescue protein Dom34
MIINSTNDNLPTNPHSVKADVSGSIIVNRCVRINNRHITSKSNFFSEPMIIKIDNEKIIFKRASLGYNGKTNEIKLSKKTGHYHTTIACEIPIGKFEFDTDESDEDCKVVYYR